MATWPANQVEEEAIAGRQHCSSRWNQHASRRMGGKLWVADAGAASVLTAPQSEKASGTADARYRAPFPLPRPIFLLLISVEQRGGLLLFIWLGGWITGMRSDRYFTQIWYEKIQKH